MEKYENNQARETTKDVIVRELTDEKNGLAFAREYLKADFLAAAVDALFYARRQAGLTQEQVAQQLGKKQEAIARWEADKEGRMSLRQYFDLALASGRVPLNMVLEPVESVRNFVINHPEGPQTPYSYFAWLQKCSEPTSAPQPPTVHALTVQAVITGAPNTALSTQELTSGWQLAVNLVEQTLKEQYWCQAGQVLVQCADPGASNTTSVSQISTLSKTQVSPACAATFQDKVAA